MRSEVRLAPVFSKILYSQAWEDPAIDLAAWGGLNSTDDVFAIGASGDQTLFFALQGPRSIAALDFNLTQCVLLELKIRAIERLTWGEMLEFLGVRPSGRRVQYYEKLKTDLTPQARQFWDSREDAIRKGVIHSGRFENMFRIFRWTILPLVHSQKTVRALLACRSLDEQRAFFAKRWDTWRWRALFGVFFNKRVMAALGRSEAHFKYVTLDSIKGQLLRRLKHCMTEVPVETNYFVEYILTGDYADERRLPEYLLEESHPKLRKVVDRITIVNDEIEQFLPRQAEGAFSKFYLSDIFEYMPDAPMEAILRELWRAGRDGGVLSYRNLFAPRARPASMAAELQPDEKLGQELNARDRSFFYDRQVVETIRKARVPAPSPAR
ncbi:MAG TPA: DUF3419 family protein [Planctomycetota bacterium]|nr:DUF3419 family protein [Planctomycetota bacterium]